MELSEYIDGVEKKTIFELEKQLIHSRERLSFLVDYASFSPAEMRLNSSTFQWHERMPEIFNEHKQIVAEKTSQYQDGLKVRQEKDILVVTIKSNPTSAVNSAFQEPHLWCDASP